MAAGAALGSLLATASGAWEVILVAKGVREAFLGKACGVAARAGCARLLVRACVMVPVHLLR